MQKLNRRHFLTTTAGLGAAALTEGLTAASQPPADRVRLAIVGVAGRGADNLRGVRPDANIIALCDVDQNRAGPCARSLPRPPFTTITGASST